MNEPKSDTTPSPSSSSTVAVTPPAAAPEPAPSPTIAGTAAPLVCVRPPKGRKVVCGIPVVAPDEDDHDG